MGTYADDQDSYNAVLAADPWGDAEPVPAPPAAPVVVAQAPAPIAPSIASTTVAPPPVADTAEAPPSRSLGDRVGSALTAFGGFLGDVAQRVATPPPGPSLAIVRPPPRPPRRWLPWAIGGGLLALLLLLFRR